MFRSITHPMRPRLIRLCFCSARFGIRQGCNLKPSPDQPSRSLSIEQQSRQQIRSGTQAPRKWRGRPLAGHPYAARASGRLEILGTETGVLGDPAQRRRTHFFAVVKTESEVRPTQSLHFPMRADLFLERPTEPYQSRVDSLGLRGAPDAHAANKTFNGAGTSSPLSIMSART